MLMMNPLVTSLLIWGPVFMSAQGIPLTLTYVHGMLQLPARLHLEIWKFCQGNGSACA